MSLTLDNLRAAREEYQKSLEEATRKFLGHVNAAQASGDVTVQSLDIGIETTNLFTADNTINGFMLVDTRVLLQVAV